jgi:hypothetical protein
MDTGDQSVTFIEKQMDENFNQIMSANIVEDMYWIETEIGARCVAKMFELNQNENKLNNLFVLFPPFVPID